MAVDPSVSLRTLRTEYREACAVSNAIIEETARHAGHADIIREQIDGERGR
jgi:Protein of unknown function (DUF664)